MKPFDKVSIKVTKSGTEYTCGAEVLNTYTANGTAMCTVCVHGMGGTETMTLKQSECTTI